MPIPTPSSGETQKDFISRCISQLADEDPDMPNKQRQAICFNTWRRSKGEMIEMHPDFDFILQKYRKQHGDVEGTRLFNEWIEKHRLDPDKPYQNTDQLYEHICSTGLCESFRWIDKPLMTFLNMDEDATFWKVVALTANVSQNKNDYTDIEDFKNTAASLSWRPLDWNHDHNNMLPFPEARTELARFEDNAVETIIRIPNDLMHYSKPILVNDMIRNGDIIHVSIEGTPRGVKRTEKGVAPQHWNFTGLALLERDVTLPGDPLTYIEPLFLNESMGRSLVESLMEKGRELEDMTETEYEEKTEELGEAVWTRAYINDLPDNSFAYISPGGKKDDEGKTVPRSLRHLPYKDSQGNIDQAHTRNALARLPQTDIPSQAKAQARTKLVAAAKKAGIKVQELVEDYTGIQGMDVCAQCRFFEDLSDTTTTSPKITGQTDSAVITRTSGGIGAGIGICRVATELLGSTQLRRKSDAVCTDGRPREAPTDVDRIKEEITMDEIEKIAMIAEHKRRIADMDNRVLEEMKRTSVERELKLKALKQVSDRDITLKDKQREVANLTSTNTTLIEDRDRLRKDSDDFREEISIMKIGITEKDKDIKHYKDRYDAYKRTNKELGDEVIMLKERLSSSIAKEHDALEKGATHRQHAINAQQEKARIQDEYAQVMEQLSNATRDNSDSAQIRATQAKKELKDTREIIKLRKQVEDLIEELRNMKQKLSKRPAKIRVKG